MRRTLLSRTLTAFALILLLAPVRPSAAAELPAPAGPVILTVDGRIAHRNAAEGALFDRAMLAAMPQTTLRITTPWTEGEITFEGILARELMAVVGATGTTVSATALDDYQVELPMADFAAHDVLLALQMNGEPMRVRDKGPIWVVYPAGAGNTSGPIADRMVWQLRQLTVR